MNMEPMKSKMKTYTKRAAIAAAICGMIAGGVGVYAHQADAVSGEVLHRKVK